MNLVAETSLEIITAEAVVRYLEKDVTLREVPPRVWNSDLEAVMPRISVKANQGEEMAYRTGIYRMAVEIKIVTHAKGDELETWTRLVRGLMASDKTAHDRITDLKPNVFRCFAVEPKPSSSSSSKDKRMRTLNFDLIAFAIENGIVL